jgi:hypothetical protein
MKPIFALFCSMIISSTVLATTACPSLGGEYSKQDGQVMVIGQTKTGHTDVYNMGDFQFIADGRPHGVPGFTQTATCKDSKLIIVSKHKSQTLGLMKFSKRGTDLVEEDENGEIAVYLGK